MASYELSKALIREESKIISGLRQPSQMDGFTQVS